LRSSAHRRTALLRLTKSDGAPSYTRAAAIVLLGATALRIADVPDVDLHGPLHYLGIMDPLCGGTRATFL